MLTARHEIHVTALIFKKRERITALGRPEERRLFITSKADAPPAARGRRDWHPCSLLSAAFVQS